MISQFEIFVNNLQTPCYDRTYNLRNITADCQKQDKSNCNSPAANTAPCLRAAPLLISGARFIRSRTMTYYERIRALREDSDLTQKDMANYLKIAQNTYSQYENGKRQIPLDILIEICRFFHVSSDYILGLSDRK